MKSKILGVTIDRALQEVWEFTTNPANTHTWLDFIEEEWTSVYPAHVGATYWNRSAGEVNEYEVVTWEPPTQFCLKNKCSGLTVDYTYEALGEDACRLQYTETTQDGELSQIFSQAQLNRLKEAMEAAS